MTATTDIDDVLARLDASAALVEQHEAALTTERQRRRELIYAARDGGVSWSAIGHAARLTRTRCMAIVAGELAAEHDRTA